MGETVYTSRTSGGETACIRTKLSERAREKKKKDLAPRETRVFSSARQRLERRKEVLCVPIAAYLLRSLYCRI